MTMFSLNHLNEKIQAKETHYTAYQAASTELTNYLTQATLEDFKPLPYQISSRKPPDLSVGSCQYRLIVKPDLTLEQL